MNQTAVCMMKKVLLSFCMVCLMSADVDARNVILDPNVKSLVTTVNGDWLSMPVMRLHSNDVLSISFDELSHEYHRYTYRIEHCETDWSPSTSLFESDWLEGFNNNPIDDYEASTNTTVPYTHYTFKIPNEQVRSLKLSGNYRIHICEDDRDVMRADFWVTEESMPLTLTATTNTDIDANASHQQISATLGYGKYRIINPADQIYLVVMQNGHEDSQKAGLHPTIVKADGVEWQHCRDFIFDAGNEYHKFEVLDVSHTTMGLDQILWNDKNYVAFPFINEPRKNYLYDEDVNGYFIIRNSDNWQSATTCDYVWVTYHYKCPPLTEGEMLVNGLWATDADRSDYVMEYNETAGMYTAQVLQKLGYYSFQYLWQLPDGQLKNPPEEGSFYQTENEYQAFAYFRGTSERTWRLVAYRKVALNSSGNR